MAHVDASTKLIPLIEYVPLYCSIGGRSQIVQVRINGVVAFQERTWFPTIFGWLVGDNKIQTSYLLSPEGITAEWWLAQGAERDWIWENPYGEGYWCSVPEDLEKAIDLEFALRAMDSAGACGTEKGG